MELEQENRPKSYWWVWLLVFLVLAFAVGVYFFYVKKTSESVDTNTSKTAETWLKSDKVVFDKLTSVDTHKLDDGTYRMYAMVDGKIMYSNSKDLETFDTPLQTGITEDEGMMISNPAVLEIKDGEWIMLYEQKAATKGQDNQGPPSSQSQRNLYLATSQDGKTFTKSSLAVDSAKEDNYFASVPDLVKLTDGNLGKIRMYYVCGGEAICSRISEDNGKTWTKEEGIRLGDQAVDPDVIYSNGKWIMYYSILDPKLNGIYKATSKDGLTWTKSDGQVITKLSAKAFVDPDVVEISPGNYKMFFGKSSGDSSTGGEQIDLYSATYKGSIF